MPFHNRLWRPVRQKRLLLWLVRKQLGRLLRVRGFSRRARKRRRYRSASASANKGVQDGRIGGVAQPVPI